MSGAAPSHDILEQAAAWFALLRSSDASAQDRAAWQRWLDSGGSQRAAWDMVERVSSRFEPVQAAGQQRAAASALQAARAAGRGRRQALAGVALLAGSGLLGWGAWRAGVLGELNESLLAAGAGERTGSGEIRRLALADGSSLWLNTASAADVHFDGALRRVVLLRGELSIQTAHGDRRPLVVDTPHGRLRALGTRFTVRLAQRATYLGVFDGAVEARPQHGAARVLQAGQQAHLDSAAVGAPQPARAARDAWTRGVLLAEDITLGELVAELGRYRQGRLAVAPEVAQLRVLGAYPLRNTDQALAMLETALPVRVRRTLPWWVSVEPR